MPRKKERGVVGEGAQELLALDEAAALLRVSRSTLYRWQQQGRIRGRKVGRLWRFRRSELEKLGQVSHPSAAAVNVAEVERVLGSPAARAQAESIVVEPALPGYPSTEEEKAVFAVFRTILREAVQANASDIHLDAARDGAVIRQRIDGLLHEVMRLPRSAHDALVSCIKAHAGIPVDQRLLPGDGRLRLRTGDREYDVRTATIPAVHGESVVMRVLAQSAELPPLDRLGMCAEDRERYERALHSPTGLLIVSGPTGSGKTTVLYAGLQTILSSERKFMSVEDPVEYSFPHVTQVSVNRKAGLTFETAERAFLRHDPDVVMIGDIRTLEGAELAAQIAITGHLVLTQLHATSAAGAITRLLDMGLEPFVLAQTLVCVMSVRLARKVCEACAKADQPDSRSLPELAQRAAAGGYVTQHEPGFRRGAGCEVCRQTGYRGRTGIYEVMENNREVERLIVSRASRADLERAAVRAGITTLAADGMRKAAAGITTVEEALRVLPDLRD